MRAWFNDFMVAWSARVGAFPVFPGRSMLPRMDGDIAWLDELADRIIDGGLAQPVDIPPSDDWHYRNTIGKTNISPQQILRYWPADLAGAMLQSWQETPR